ncbi:MAG: glycosyltransferase family 2 protein [Pseudanabaenaceae cyanobacterium]
MPKPLVSAIVPCYNAAPFLRETLDSLLAQNAAVSEIIVVNDGSTDDTAAILTSYGDRRPQFGHALALSRDIKERFNFSIVKGYKFSKAITKNSRGYAQ